MHLFGHNRDHDYYFRLLREDGREGQPSGGLNWASDTSPKRLGTTSTSKTMAVWALPVVYVNQSRFTQLVRQCDSVGVLLVAVVFFRQDFFKPLCLLFCNPP